MTVPLNPLIPHLTPSQLDELTQLRRELRIIQAQIREIAGEAALITRVDSDCLRCGYHWTPYNQYLPPICCPRCGTTAWNLPPTSTSRKPSDPPSPSWRIRKGGRRPKYREYVPKHDDFGNPTPAAQTVRWHREQARIQKIGEVPRVQEPPAQQQPWVQPQPQTQPTIGPPWPWDSGNAIPPPPLPPPQAPAAPPGQSSFPLTLSERLAMARSVRPESQEPPQPERIASHAAAAAPAAAPASQDNYEMAMDHLKDEAEIAEDAAEATEPPDGDL
jgi:hypothetical protein